MVKSSVEQNVAVGGMEGVYRTSKPSVDFALSVYRAGTELQWEGKHFRKSRERVEDLDKNER